MSHSVHTSLSIVARLITACAALLLLTSTVLQRNDPDGYQATHLFFMPRQTWEMDGGVGMLHDPDYYASIDKQALNEESGGNYPSDIQPSLISSSVQVLKASPVSVFSSNMANAEKITLSRTGPLESLAGNTIPVEQTGADYSWELGQAFLLLFTALSLTVWLGDIPTPPPRRLTTA